MSVTDLIARAYTIPTDRPEADGTIEWNSTTMVVVEITDGDTRGLGWTYGGAGCLDVIRGKLAPVIVGSETSDIPRSADAMARACRNLGRPGIAACAISAVDVALWDLRARQLSLPLVDLLGRARDSVPVYGSGGFTTYDDDTTVSQLEKWVDRWSIPRVKIKIGESWGTEPGRDLERVALARRVIGGAELFVDANGAYGVKQAVGLGRKMAEVYGVTWFEEPVSSDDLTGLSQVREAFDGDVAAGEYGYSLGYFAVMLAGASVDCIQADATRCGGYTVWRRVAALAEANQRQISGHCAPNLHAHVAASVPNLRHCEYFHDHHRIETMLFEGTLDPDGGAMTPDRSAPGHGLVFRDTDAERFRVA